MKLDFQMSRYNFSGVNADMYVIAIVDCLSESVAIEFTNKNGTLFIQ